MQIDLILGVVSFSGIVLALVVVIIGARSQLVSTGNVSIEINGDSSNPIIVPAGKTVVPVDDGSFNGFIIDNASFEGFHTTLAANGTYTVANDKILVVTSWFSQSEMGNSQEKYKIDNITVVSYGRQHSLLMVPSGSTLKNANPNSQSSCITGYLISK